MRFSKSIKVGEHSRVNVSKSGVSFTVGVKGLSVNVGPKGVYLNTSIPGTGISDRKKIMDNPFATNTKKNSSGKSGSKNGTKSVSGKSAPKQVAPAIDLSKMDLTIRKNEDGVLEFYDGDRKITDEAVIRKIKASEQYQAQKEAIDAAFRQEMADKAEEYNTQNARLIDVGALAPVVYSEADVRNGTIQSGDAAKVLAGDPGYIKQELERWLTSLAMPLDFSVQYEYDEENHRLWLDLDLPEIEDLPDEKADQLESGKMRVKKKTQTELRADYAKCVFGFATLFAASTLNLSTVLQDVVISAYTQRRNSAGDLNDDFIYSIDFTRSGMEHRNLAQEDPIAACMDFKNRCNMSKTYVFKVITPFEAEDLA